MNPATATMLDALDRLAGTGPEFGGFLANHGPMAADALVHLGAGEVVAAWVDRYRTQLEPAPSERSPIADTDWREHLGHEERIGDWTALLQRQGADGDWRSLLTCWWPRLLPGLAASATHGVIRTGHAVRALRSAGAAPDQRLVDELARGLAFWAALYQELPGAPTLAGSNRSAVDVISAAPRLDPAIDGEGAGIVGRLRALRHLDGLPGALDQWQAPAEIAAALDDIVAAAARVLAARDDNPIAYCHGVTAPAAVRLVVPELPEAMHGATVAATWQVVAGIVAAFAAPPVAAETHSAEPDSALTDHVESSANGRQRIEHLAVAAVEHGDEHVIKLTEAALREHARTGDDTLLVAAERFRRRLDPPGR